MLGHDDGRAEFLVEAPQEPDELVARDRVELGGRLVEQEQRRTVDHRRGDRDALQLAARERVGAPLEQVRDAEGERRLLDRAGYAAGRLAPVFERQLELGAHAAHHDLALGLLEDRAADRGQVAGAVLAHVEPADTQLAARLAAVEVRDEPAERAQECRLPRAGDAREHREGARLELERDVLERLTRPVRVAVAEAVGERERHGLPPTPSRARRPANGASATRTIAAASAHTSLSHAISKVG